MLISGTTAGRTSLIGNAAADFNLFFETAETIRWTFSTCLSGTTFDTVLRVFAFDPDATADATTSACEEGLPVGENADVLFVDGSSFKMGLTQLECQEECRSAALCFSYAFSDGVGHCELWSASGEQTTSDDPTSRTCSLNDNFGGTGTWGDAVFMNDDAGGRGCENSEASTIEAVLTAGVRYWVVVEGYGEAEGPFQLQVVGSWDFGLLECTEPSGECTEHVVGSTRGRPDFLGNASPDFRVFFTTTQTLRWNFTTCDPGTNFDTFLRLYAVSDAAEIGEESSFIDSNDDSEAPCRHGGDQSAIVLTVLPAGNYLLLVEGLFFEGSTQRHGEFALIMASEIYGSCELQCGRSAVICSCDLACVERNDCCHDFGAHCFESLPSFPDILHCEDACAYRTVDHIAAAPSDVTKPLWNRTLSFASDAHVVVTTCDQDLRVVGTAVNLTVTRLGDGSDGTGGGGSIVHVAIPAFPGCCGETGICANGDSRASAEWTAVHGEQYLLRAVTDIGHFVPFNIFVTSLTIIPEQLDLSALILVSVENQDCVCLANWESPEYKANCTDQVGCEANTCDGDPNAWCEVANPGCSTERSGISGVTGGLDKWSYCTPGVTSIREPEPTTRTAIRPEAFFWFVPETCTNVVFSTLHCTDSVLRVFSWAAENITDDAMLESLPLNLLASASEWTPLVGSDIWRHDPECSNKLGATFKSGVPYLVSLTLTDREAFDTQPNIVSLDSSFAADGAGLSIRAASSESASFLFAVEAAVFAPPLDLGELGCSSDIENGGALGCDFVGASVEGSTRAQISRSGGGGGFPSGDNLLRFSTRVANNVVVSTCSAQTDFDSQLRLFTDTTHAVNPHPLAICSNSCALAFDGHCDDGVEGVPTVLCGDTCAYNGDKVCDDGGPGAEFDVCAFGSDCSDCGVRTCGIGSDCADCGARAFIRATSGQNAVAGVPFIPEVYFEGKYRPLCGLGGFTDNSNGANAVCRALGFSSGILHSGNSVTIDDGIFENDAIFVGACYAGQTLSACRGHGPNEGLRFGDFPNMCSSGERVGVNITCIHVTAPEEDCICASEWDLSSYDPKCTNQLGCADPSCDNDPHSWCVVTKPGCATAEGNAGTWTYCTPGVTAISTSPPIVLLTLAPTVQKPDCVCAAMWDQSLYNPNCANQLGCPNGACDNDVNTWCDVINPGCDTAEGDDGIWSYCTPGVTIIESNECVCAAMWDLSLYNPNCTNQVGCNDPSCDGDLPWCLVINAGCATSQGTAGTWAYCTPGVTPIATIAPTAVPTPVAQLPTFISTATPTTSSTAAPFQCNALEQERGGSTYTFTSIGSMTWIECERTCHSLQSLMPCVRSSAENERLQHHTERSAELGAGNSSDTSGAWLGLSNLRGTSALSDVELWNGGGICSSTGYENYAPEETKISETSDPLCTRMDTLGYWHTETCDNPWVVAQCVCTPYHLDDASTTQHVVSSSEAQDCPFGQDKAILQFLSVPEEQYVVLIEGQDAAEGRYQLHVDGSALTSCGGHDECGGAAAAHPFCHRSGVCTFCSECRRCHDGIDESCGEFCGSENYPIIERATCAVTLGKHHQDCTSGCLLSVTGEDTVLEPDRTVRNAYNTGDRLFRVSFAQESLVTITTCNAPADMAAVPMYVAVVMAANSDGNDDGDGAYDKYTYDESFEYISTETEMDCDGSQNGLRAIELTLQAEFEYTLLVGGTKDDGPFQLDVTAFARHTDMPVFIVDGKGDFVESFEGDFSHDYQNQQFVLLRNVGRRESTADGCMNIKATTCTATTVDTVTPTRITLRESPFSDVDLAAASVRVDLLSLRDAISTDTAAAAVLLSAERDDFCQHPLIFRQAARVEFMMHPNTTYLLSIELAGQPAPEVSTAYGFEVVGAPVAPSRHIGRLGSLVRSVQSGSTVGSPSFNGGGGGNPSGDAVVYFTTPQSTNVRVSTCAANSTFDTFLRLFDMDADNRLALDSAATTCRTAGAPVEDYVYKRYSLQTWVDCERTW
jgi:hypothetical protein